ncbi:MAG TPA: ATP-binding protein [Thermoanaerobaculia bacterium]|nr:ATP-binding protein [Thermoanaerobaculia bacterium]
MSRSTDVSGIEKLSSFPTHDLRSIAFDALPAHIALLDSRGIILEVNEAWRRFAIDNGFRGESLGVGDDYLAVCANSCGEGREDAEDVAAGIRDVLSGASGRFEMEYPCHTDGQRRWFRLMVTPLPGEPRSGAVVMHVDVTARRLAEERLALLSDAAARLLLHERPRELLRDLFGEISRQLDLEVYFNFLVHPSGEHLVLDSFAGIPEDVAASLERLDFGQAVCGRVALEQKGQVVESVQGRCDGMTSLIRSFGIQAYFCHPLIARDRLLGTLSFGTRRRERFAPDELELMRTVGDQVAVALERVRLIDELTERGREAEQARAEAVAATQAKDEFLAALSHELRTPLTPVLLTAHALAADPRLPADLKPELERMRRNIDFEARLIDDLLDLTRIARGKLEIQPEVADVHGLLEHVVAISGGAFADKGIRPRLELSAEESRVWGDPARLEQIFWNLLSNAAKFTDRGGDVLIRTDNDAAGNLAVRVIDTGIGIDPATLSQIFDAFEQGGAQVTRRFGGLGLGLAISKALTGLHGGLIEAESGGRGRGAAFTVLLPAVSGTPAGDPAGERRLSGPARSRHILLVEDHADTAEAVADFLRSAGHRVTLAGSVREALSRAREAQERRGDDAIDLVVSDLGLPDGSGLDIMPELKERYGLPGIALSGYGMEEDVRRSREAGFEIHITKPVIPQILSEAIERAGGDRS